MLLHICKKCTNPLMEDRPSKNKDTDNCIHDLKASYDQLQPKGEEKKKDLLLKVGENVGKRANKPEELLEAPNFFEDVSDEFEKSFYSGNLILQGKEDEIQLPSESKQSYRDVLCKAFSEDCEELIKENTEDFELNQGKIFDKKEDYVKENKFEHRELVAEKKEKSIDVAHRLCSNIQESTDIKLESNVEHIFCQGQPKEKIEELPNSFWGEENDLDLLKGLSGLSFVGTRKPEIINSFEDEILKDTNINLMDSKELKNRGRELNVLSNRENHPIPQTSKINLEMPADPLVNQNLVFESKAGMPFYKKYDERASLLGERDRSSGSIIKESQSLSKIQESSVPGDNNNNQKLPTQSDYDLIFSNKPLVLFLMKKVILTYAVRQHRQDSRNRTQVEFFCNIFMFFSFSYDLPALTDSDCSSIFDEMPILKTIFSSDINVTELVNSIIPDFSFEYTSSRIDEVNNSFEQILEMFFLNQEISIKKSVEDKCWSLAMFLSHNTKYQDYVHKAFIKYINPALHPFFGQGELDEDWRKTFVFLIRRPSNKIYAKLIPKLGYPEILIVFLSFYFVHGQQFDIRYFFNNFYFLKLALNYNIQISGIDRLLLRYLKVMQEGGDADISMISNKYKTILNKSETKKGWFEGIKDAVDKSISKIVGVEEDFELNLNCSSGDLERVNSNKSLFSDTKFDANLKNNIDPVESIHGEKKEIKTEPKLNSMHREFVKHDYNNLPTIDQRNSMNDFIGMSSSMKTYSQNGIKRSDLVLEGKYSDNSLQESYLNDGRNHDTIEATFCSTNKPDFSSIKLENNSRECGSDGDRKSTFYGKKDYSKSCTNLKNYTESIIPGVMHEDVPLDRKNESFFSKFNIFSKKKSYKVNLNSNNNFKYDPSTKKWTNLNTKGTTQQISSKPLKKEIPMPGIVKKSINIDTDNSIRSRYSNSVSKQTNENEFMSFLPRRNI